MEHFQGVTLTTWVERYGPGPQKKAKADLKTRTDLWIRIAETIDYAHQQGVVHRLLRPDVVLVEDEVEPKEIRVTGFELAKQLAHDTTVSLTTISDEWLDFAAPEVVRRFSDAAHASDQFSLGAILGLLLTGQRLFESTRQLLTLRRLVRHVRDLAPRTPQRLDEAVTRMVAVRPTDRYPTLEAAVADVKTARDPDALTTAPLFPEAQAHLDVENLVARTRLEPDYEVEKRLGQGGMAVVYAALHITLSCLYGRAVAADAILYLIREFSGTNRTSQPVHIYGEPSTSSREDAMAARRNQRFRISSSVVVGIRARSVSEGASREIRGSSGEPERVLQHCYAPSSRRW